MTGPTTDCVFDTTLKVWTWKDKSTNQLYTWNASSGQWCQSSGPTANSDASVPRYHFDGQTYKYDDPSDASFEFVWNASDKEWLRKPKSSVANIDKDTAKDEDDEDDEDDCESNSDAKEYGGQSTRKDLRKTAPGWTQSEMPAAASVEQLRDPLTGVLLKRDKKDGMLYEWDEDKRAWFPRIDEDFMAQYQMDYGFTQDGVAEPTRPDEPTAPEIVAEDDPTGDKMKLQGGEKRKPGWFSTDESKSTKVYVSGLPTEPGAMDTDAFVTLMSKCGSVDVDIRTNQPKVKLYRTKDGHLKGDGLCTYVRVESVDLALQILDGYQVDEKHTLGVEVAKFQMKGDYDASLKPRKLRKKEIDAMKKRREKLFAWQPEAMRGQRSKRDKVVVVAGLFSHDELVDSQSGLEQTDRVVELKSRLTEHCAEFGQVRRVVVYPHHRDGIAQVFFAEADQADLAVASMNGRLFWKGKQTLSVKTWDGKTKYKTEETAEEEAARLANWDDFLNSGGDVADND